jgi:hypothetical protein
VRVGVDQQGQQHLRRERRLPRTAQLVAGLECAQVHHRHHADDQVDDVALGQPVHHVGRKQEGLTSFRFTKIVRHRSIRVVGEHRSNRASLSLSTPKHTEACHCDIPESNYATGSFATQKARTLNHAQLPAAGRCWTRRVAQPQRAYRRLEVALPCLTCQTWMSRNQTSACSILAVYRAYCGIAGAQVTNGMGNAE